MGTDWSVQVGLGPEPFDPYPLLARWSGSHTGAAESHFVGRVRPFSATGAPLDALELEHYPGMAERQLRQLALACAEQHGACSVLVHHRVGRIGPGEAIVLVAVGADRRGPAQRCCRDLLEALKHHAPFWKREWSGGQGTWVAGNTPYGEGG
jgi:molybdopterin synthase catalytic subunit